MSDVLNKDASFDSARKLSVKTKIGYGLGSVGDMLMYNFFFVFYMFFLTDFVGIEPGIAGTILLISVLWDCVTDPVVGYLSDNSSNPKGRRTPFIKKGIIPWIIVTCLAFMAMDFSPGVNIVYYTLMGMAFWTAFTVIQVPYFAMVPELTTDDGERTSLRVYAVALGCVGSLVLSAVPMMLEALTGFGLSESGSWTGVAFISVAICGVCYYIVYLTTRKYDIENFAAMGDEEKQEKVNIIKVFGDVFRITGFLQAVLAYFVSLVAYVMILSLVMYLTSYKLQLDDKMTSIAMASYTFAQVLFLPLINSLAKKYGHLKTFIWTLIPAGVGMMLFKVIGIDSFSVLIFHALVASFVSASFYSLIFQFSYDVMDLHYIKTGKKEEGAIISVFALLGKLGGAFAGLLVGLLLEWIQYNPDIAVQTQRTLDGFVTINTIIPGGIFVLGGLLIFLFPITTRKSEAIRDAIALRDAREEFSTKGFEDLM